MRAALASLATAAHGGTAPAALPSLPAVLALELHNVHECLLRDQLRESAA